MKKKLFPRLLPLVAVAIVGVLAINLLAGAGSLPELLQGPLAWAEDAPAEEEDAEATDPGLPPLTGPEPQAEANVCAPTPADLALRAGLSPSEIMLLERLSQRRAELDEREADIDTQMQLLAAAEEKVDGRIGVMGGLIEEMRGLLGIADEQEETETMRLVKVYETMKPKDAAPALARMSNGVRLPILSRMSERKLAAVLGEMTPAQAQEITELLAGQTADAFSFTRAREVAAEAPPAPAPAPQAAAPPPAETGGG